MMNTHELEAKIIAIHNQTHRSSEAFMDECFAERIDLELTKLPVDSRDEFMRLALLHGYKTPAERGCNLHPEQDGFSDDFYDDLFPPEDDEWLH